MPPPISAPFATGLTITNPLVLYRALVATHRIEPDPAQHRVALHLHKLYIRLKDYSPQTEYGARLRVISRAAKNISKDEGGGSVAIPGHGLRRNPLFSHLFLKKDQKDTLALTPVLTSQEAAMKLDSPRGLLLHGEVGTGKSMLVDLLAESLPNQRKRRWHFNTFMLETLARLEELRQSRSGLTSENPEYSLFWLAKDMIEKSPILFLDEFQLPDRAASKILSNLLTTFFQLGGVLIASSNRMPDELAKASGTEFAPLPNPGFVKSWLRFGAEQDKGSVLPANSEYLGFVEVLKARCEIWDMGVGKDWRRAEAEEVDDEAPSAAAAIGEERFGGFAGLEKTLSRNVGLGPDRTILDRTAEVSIANSSSKDSDEEPTIVKAKTPRKYLLASPDSEKTWNSFIQTEMPPEVPYPIPWKSTTLLVYGRKVPVPKHIAGVAYWTFPELCGGMFGPADYITLASTFHTTILDEVPVISLGQKNEARRLITLLDALYEARCKLIIRAEAGPDDLFFPEPTTGSSASHDTEFKPNENDGGDAIYPETLSEIYQDQTSPFRPNVSSYTEEPKTGYDPDEDSDFGPLPGAGNEIGRKIDFGMTSSFTGEDERFAYKRARSRLWEMCGAKWHARSEPGWWKPLPLEVRRWERSSSSSPTTSTPKSVLKGDVQLGKSIEVDKPAGLQRKNLEERETRIVNPLQELAPPPKFDWTHAWGMIKWGKRAGRWGEGADGLSVRNDRNGNSR